MRRRTKSPYDTPGKRSHSFATRDNSESRKYLINGTTHVAIMKGGDMIVVDASKYPEILFEDAPGYDKWKRRIAHLS